MTISVYPIAGEFGAEIGDVDLSRPLDAATVDAIKAAFWTHAVLVFPGQALDTEQHLAFARHFGPIEPSFGKQFNHKARLEDSLVDVSNLSGDGQLWSGDSYLRLLREGDKLWHTDSSFNFRPAQASILHGTSIAPVGGFTLFADMRAAWDGLEGWHKRQLEPLVAVHNWFASRKRYGLDDFPEEMRASAPPVPQLLVRTLPESGRRALFLASHIERFVGMGAEESLALADELIAHATQPQYLYRHRWRQGDVVMWDNRCTMHRATDYDDLRWRRDFRRATVSDVGNTLTQAGVPVPDEFAGLAAA